MQNYYESGGTTVVSALLRIGMAIGKRMIRWLESWKVKTTLICRVEQ